MNYFMHNISKKVFMFAGGVFFLLLTFGAALPAAAATITASQTEVSVKSGDTFSVTYTINPQGVKNYTAKLVLNFPPELLKVNSVQFGSGWTVLSQPGYDSVDNAKGVLIKTAGYPKGISSPTLFATVQFQAIGTATGTISVQSSSFVLNATSKNVLAKGPVTTQVLIAAPRPIVASSTQKSGQSLFDVSLGVAPAPSCFNWIPWALIVALLLCLLVACGIAARLWHRVRVMQKRRK